MAISGYAFKPAGITVARDTRITFTNRDATAHTATAVGGAFDTGTLNAGARQVVVLKNPGTYSFYCQFHAFMRGTITVVK